MSTKEKKIIAETFRLNADANKDKEIIEFLATSNNKSGLIKDALNMYKAMIDRGMYVSPYIKKDATDWDKIFSNLDPSKMITGRRPEDVKESVKQEIKEYDECQKQYKPEVDEPVVEEQEVEPVVEEVITIEDETSNDGDDDNDLDF